MIVGVKGVSFWSDIDLVDCAEAGAKKVTEAQIELLGGGSRLSRDRRKNRKQRQRSENITARIMKSCIDKP